MPRIDNRGGARRGAGRKAGPLLRAVPIHPPSVGSMKMQGGVEECAPEEAPEGFCRSSLSSYGGDSEDPATVPAVTALAQLPAAMQVAIRHSARGMTGVEIAHRLGKGDDTIRRWLHSHPDAVDEAVREMVDPADFVRPMVPAALRALREILDAPEEPSVRLAAARDVLDRNFGKPPVRADVVVRSAPVVHVHVYEQLSAENQRRAVASEPLIIDHVPRSDGT